MAAGTYLQLKRQGKLKVLRDFSAVLVCLKIISLMENKAADFSHTLARTTKASLINRQLNVEIGKSITRQRFSKSNVG